VRKKEKKRGRDRIEKRRRKKRNGREKRGWALGPMRHEHEERPLG
jgi:hypothetical protein